MLYVQSMSVSSCQLLFLCWTEKCRGKTLATFLYTPLHYSQSLQAVIIITAIYCNIISIVTSFNRLDIDKNRLTVCRMECSVEKGGWCCGIQSVTN